MSATGSCWECITRRDARAERRFYEASVALVHRLAWHMTGDRDPAEDLTQQIFLRAFARAGQFRDDGPARAWLLRIARPIILNDLSHRRMRQRRGLSGLTEK